MQENISLKIIPKELKWVLLVLLSIFLLVLTISEGLEIKDKLTYFYSGSKNQGLGENQ